MPCEVKWRGGSVPTANRSEEMLRRVARQFVAELRQSSVAIAPPESLIAGCVVENYLDRWRRFVAAIDQAAQLKQCGMLLPVFRRYHVAQVKLGILDLGRRPFRAYGNHDRVYG